MTEPYQSGYLPEQDGHRVYYACYGNSDGVPALFLHGGPGGGFSEKYLNLFDLDATNLVTFDQRGCGKSEPLGTLAYNTTSHLIADTERLRDHLNIPKWMVCGHSWGTTLALCYLDTFPAYCTGVSLAGYFRGQAEDQDWTFNGLSRFFPQEIAALHTLNKTGGDLNDWIFGNLSGSDNNLAYETAYRLAKLEAAICRLMPYSVTYDEIGPADIAACKILFHYARNGFFLVKRVPAPADIPVSLVHGRFDMDCLPEAAYDLKAQRPHLDLVIVQGGHSVFEEPMAEAYKTAIRKMMSCMSG